MEDLVVSQKTTDTVKLVELGSIKTATDGTVSTHVFQVNRVARSVQGQDATYEDWLLVYDCKSQTLAPRIGMMLSDKFDVIGMLEIPADAEPWTSSNERVARMWGYDLVCRADSRSTAEHLTGPMVD